MNARRTNRNQNNPKKVTFESIFEETLPHTNFIWQPVDNANQPEPQLTILSGKLLLKSETDSWEPYLFELQADRLFRMGDILECCYLRGCFLKKFNHSDVAYPMHKYGFRIQLGQQLAFFITDSPDQFKKWFLMLKRFCILEKFTRKYKVIAQLKYNDPIFQQVCFTCVRLSDAGYYLVKIIPKDLSQQQKNVLFKELHHLRRLNHPQLMRLIEVYEDENNLYQVFDQYMGGDLRQHLRETSQAYEVGGQIEEKILADMMFGLIGALAHMHSRGVFHRDIKLDNLFVPENRRLPFVLLSNFCYSESFKLSGPSPGYKKCGTPGYVAPEIFKSKNYDAKIDVFSLGVVLYILVYGRMPFEGQDQEEILKCNERCEIDFKAERKLCKAISNSGIDLMKKMLDKDPNKRFTSLQALNHHWFIKNKSKDDSRPKQLQKMRSLSTIVENSEIMELTQRYLIIISSFIGKSNYKLPKQQVKNNQFNQIQAVKRSQQRQETVEKIEKEFSFDSLEIKMQYFNQDLFAKAPSKKRHQL